MPRQNSKKAESEILPGLALIDSLAAETIKPGGENLGVDGVKKVNGHKMPHHVIYHQYCIPSEYVNILLYLFES